MHYRVVIFGVKDTTAEIVRFVQEKLCPVDLVVTIHPDVLSGNQVSGYEGLSWLEDKYARRLTGRSFSEIRVLI